MKLKDCPRLLKYFDTKKPSPSDAKEVFTLASYVSCPRDLSKVKTKIVFNLTKRQLICFSLAAVIGLPVFFLLKNTGNMTLAGCGMMLIMLPFFIFAMYERDGRTLEYVLRDMIETVFLRPRVRPYRTENFYEELCTAAQTEKEVREIVRKYSARNHGNKVTHRKKKGSRKTAG